MTVPGCVSVAIQMMKVLVRFVVVVVFAVLVAIKTHDVFYAVPPIPEINWDQYWGPGEHPASMDTNVHAFEIKFTPEMIEDLIGRLNQTRYTEPYENIGFEYGFNGKALKPIVDFWKNEYDFVEREKYLNKFPQFMTNIQGLDIHFIHVKPNVPKYIRVLPMLMLHGWPGSIREFYEVIPMLTMPLDGHDFVLELIIPSLPGFGFSQASSKIGLGASEMGVIMVNLMERLGHKKYYIQGGDWGAFVTRTMAVLNSDNILGYHTNFPSISSPRTLLKLLLASWWPSLVVEKEHESKMYPMLEKINFMMEESGYFHIQATKPDTVGVGIGNSPAGLAAYILEKFSTATNENWKYRNDGGLFDKFTPTDLIDNLMMYWVSNSATTSARIYAESCSSKALTNIIESIPIYVPTAVARFPHELSYLPDCFLKDKYLNLVQATDLPRGGHFAAFEEPKLFADDVMNAIVKFEEYYSNKDRLN